jgi:colicin import membrane protein
MTPLCKVIMARKLKTYITNLGFFELALAAPSMKAALEAWGMGHNIFHQGFARETHDAKIVAAAMAKPGLVLRRPVGTKGAFTENAALPKQLWAATAPKAGAVKAKTKTRKAETKKAKPKSAKNEKADRAAILSFEKAKARRDREREQQETRDEAKQERERAARQRDTEKTEAALARAQDRHDQAMAVLEKERDKLDRRMEIETERWEAERDALKADLRRSEP